MIFLTIEYGIVREFIIFLRYFASYLLFFLAYKTGKKGKKTSIFSATIGLTFFLISSGLMHLINTFRFYYFDVSYDLIFSLGVSAIQLVGFILFIFLVEMDNAHHNLNQTEKRFTYRLTLISLTIIIIIYPISFILIGSPSIIFIFVLIPFLFAFWEFTKKFESLDMVKKSKAFQWFIIGAVISGFSNFLNMPIIRSSIGDWASFLNSSFIVIGCSMMFLGWSRLPSLSELDWLKQMERIIILHVDSSSLLYQYDFQVESSSFLKEGIDTQLAGSAIGGISTLLKEILDSKGHIRNIDHGGKKILFKQGLTAVSILFASEFSDEVWYRLGTFHTMFEKKFSESLKNWMGDVTIFSKTQDLILKHFID